MKKFLRQYETTDMEPTMGATRNDEGNDSGSVIAMLWVGALAPLVAWGLYVSFVSLFAPLYCEPDSQGWFYGFAFVVFLIDSIGGVLAWRIYRATIGKPTPADAAVKRRRYFGLVGMFGSIIFGAAIVVQTVLVARYSGC